MKLGWVTHTLGTVTTKIGSGATPLGGNDAYKSEGISLIRSLNVYDEGFWEVKLAKIDDEQAVRLSNVVVEPGDVLLNITGASVARCCLVPVSQLPARVNQHVSIIRPIKQKLDSALLHYLLISKIYKEKLLRLGEAGATRQAITKAQLQEFLIKFPESLVEQRRIVGMLDKAFDGIATAKANAEKNLQNARALLDSHLQSVFTQHGDDWKMEKLDSLTKLARGHNPPKSKFSREQKPGYVRFYQIRDGASDEYTVYVPDTPQLHTMKKDDIMMVAYRHVGRAFRGVEGAFNVALCKISNARRDLLDDDFLFHLIPSHYVKGELLKRSERSLIPSMSIEHLREIKIPLPPIHEQRSLVRTIQQLTGKTQRLESLYQRKLAALEELKKSLLHQAFSGQL